MELYRKELKLAVIKGLDESRGSSNVPIKLTHDTSDEYINYTEQIHVRYLLDNQVKEEILPTNGSGFYIPGKPLSHDGPIELAVHLINGDIELVTNELSFVVKNAPNGTTQVDPSEFTWQQLVDQYVNAKLETFADKADMNKFKDDVNANLSNQDKKITDLQNTTKVSLDSQNTKIDNFKSEVNTSLSNQNTSINQTTSAQNSKITTLEGRMDTFTRLSEGSTTGDAELQDIRVGANGTTYDTAGNAVRGQYSQLKEDLNDASAMITKINDDSYNISPIVYDGYDTDRALTKTGKEIVNGSVILSFPVKAGSLIKVDLTNRTNGNILYFFQNTKTVPWESNTNIIGNIQTGTKYYGYLIVPNGATYLVTNADITSIKSSVYYVTSYKAMTDNGTLSHGNYTDAKLGTYAVSSDNVTGLPSEMSQLYGWLTCYVPNNLYTLVESNTQKTIWVKEGLSDWFKIYPSEKTGHNRLQGKLIAYNGDSICESRFSGFSSNGGGYPHLISQIVGGTYENKGVSGGTLAVSSAGHHVCETISTMTDDADIVCLEGGINDYWLNVPLGDFSPSDFIGTIDNTTICGALESIFRQAIDKWVGKPIVFIIVHKIATTAWTQNTAGYTFAQAREKMLAICEKYSIPVLDMWDSGGLNAYMPSLNNAFLNGGSNTHPDGCHPDVNGYKKYYVPRLISLFESILPYDE